MFEDVEDIAHRKIARVHRNGRPARRVEFVYQIVMAPLNASNFETRARERGEHLPWS